MMMWKETGSGAVSSKPHRKLRQIAPSAFVFRAPDHIDITPAALFTD
jgi:hypothetical protein